MRIGYIFSRYLHLSETFILREMWEMEQSGLEIRIYPLLRKKGKQHPRIAQLHAPVYWAPWVPLTSHFYWWRRRPVAYLRTLAEVLWCNRSDANLWLGAVAFWGKAVAIAAQMQCAGVDRVHAHYATHPALVAYIVHRLTGLPYSFTVHAHDIYCHRAMLPQKLRAAQFVIAISQFNRRLLENAVPPPRPPIHVVHCGIERKLYAAIAAKRSIMPAEPLRILSVGTLTASKGHRYLVDACAALLQRGVPFHCQIAGGGEEQNRLYRQIDHCGLGAEVELSGGASEAEVLQALAWANVFALPSIRMPNGKMEGLPVAVMEAMAAGLPVVTTRLSGIPELVVDGQTGLLVPASDAAALAHALERMCDAALRRRLGTAASASVGADFELSSNAARLATLWATEAAREVAA
ncbi:MAG: glycosyltransferase family 4 protein [Terriglobales bacterium]